AGETGGCLDRAGRVVDRVGREFEAARAAGRTAAKDSRAVLVFVAETHLQVPAARQVLRQSDRQDVALGLQLYVALGRSRCRIRNEQGTAPDPLHSGIHGVLAVARDLVEIDEVSPVTLPVVLPLQLAVVVSEIAPPGAHPGTGRVIALCPVEIEDPVCALLVQAVVLAEASVVSRNVAEAEIHRT